MSIFSHNIYENIRTRSIVLHKGAMLLHPPARSGGAWRLPGGGLEPNESLAECAQREIFEETGIRAQVGRIAFLREWIVPRFSQVGRPGSGHGFGLEIYHYAQAEEPVAQTRPEEPGMPPAQWVPLAEVPNLSIWPKELKHLCRRLAQGEQPSGALSFIGRMESPRTVMEEDPFE
jgi:8-oxo-dGTP pyrophosphatase MutT (NUDIX family)